MITSPSRRPARAAASATALTRTPALMSISFLTASVKSLTIKPRVCAAAESLDWAGLSAAFLIGFSASISAITTVRFLVLPRRNTVRVLLVPGLVLPTIRGRSLDLSTGLPSNWMMISPASTPAFSAGAPVSTARTSAPRGLPKPIDSATSLLTWSICTPIRPRVTRPVARSCSLTRTASSMGIENEMPIEPPERE